MLFRQAIEAHDISQAESLLLRGDTPENVARVVYNRARHRSQVDSTLGNAQEYTLDILERAQENTKARSSGKNQPFDRNGILVSLNSVLTPPEYDLDTKNRLWVLGQLHKEVSDFRKNPGAETSLREFVHQIQPYVSAHSDPDFRTDSGNVDYLLRGYSRAVEHALEDANRESALASLDRFTSGPQSVSEALSHTDPVAYMHDWVAADLDIHGIVQKPERALSSAADRDAKSGEPGLDLDGGKYGGLDTDHPLLRSLIHKHEPDLPSVQRDLSIAISELEKGSSERDVARLLLQRRSDLGLTDTEGRNPVARLVAGVKNQAIKVRKQAAEPGLRLGEHEKSMVDQAKSLRASYHRALSIASNSNKTSEAQATGSSEYHGLATDHPLLRQIIAAQAPNNPELQRALSLAVNGVQQGHSQQRIFRSLSSHRAASRDLAGGPPPESNLPPSLAAALPSQAPEQRPSSAQVSRAGATPAVSTVQAAQRTSLPGQVSLGAPAATQSTTAMPQAERSHGPGTVSSTQPPRPLANNKEILDLAKSVHAKFQQQLRLQQILTAPAAAPQKSISEVGAQAAKSPVAKSDKEQHSANSQTRSASRDHITPRRKLHREADQGR
jgi:hypothetical protein